MSETPIYVASPLSKKTVLGIPKLGRPLKPQRSARTKKIIAFWSLLFLVSFMLLFMVFRAHTSNAPLSLALVGPMTGNNQANGKAMVQAAQLYLEQTNAEGGIQGRPLKLVVFDDQNDPALATQIAQKIAQDTQAIAVIGHYTSATSLAASPIYHDQEIPAVSGTATADKLTLENNWYFRTTFNNTDQGAFLANYANKILGYQEGNVIYDQNIFGSTLNTAFSQTARVLGMEVHQQWGFNTNEKDNFESVLNTMIADLKSQDGKKLLFVATHAKEAIAIITAAKYINDLQIIGADPFSSSSFLDMLQQIPQERTSPGYYTNGIYTTSPFLADIAGEKAQDFEYGFIERYQTKPSITSAMYYDSTAVIVQALKTVETHQNLKTLRTQLKRSIESFSSLENSVEGVTGRLYFDEHGDAIKSIPIGIYKQGQPVVASYQYQPLATLRGIDNVLQEVLDKRIVIVNNKFMRKARVVYTGIDFNEISEVNTQTGYFEADFYLWFRFTDEFRDDQIEFVNILNPQSNRLDVPIISQTSQLEPGVTTRTYRVKTKFKGDFDFRDYPLDQQNLPIKFRHLDLTRDRLIYVVDTQGMSSLRLGGKMLAEQFERKKVFTVGGWKVSKVGFYQDVKKNDSTLGLPELFGSKQRIEYSQFNAVITIKRHIMNFILKNSLSLIFLVLLGYFAFFIPDSAFSTRVTLGTSLIMTGSLYHLKLASELHSIDYLVLMEYFFYLIYALAVFILVVSVVSHVKGSSDPTTKLFIDRLNLAGRILYPLLIIGMVAAIGLSYSHLFIE